ncbi:hypothetical protein [Planctopirus hydrillae]|nr:hypothetical protein [Planctopirus hydrillae]
MAPLWCQVTTLKDSAMDFAVCPSCKQSVLDDDAVDCPFCGAPMKGGPRPGGAPAKPATSKAAQSSKSVSASATNTASAANAVNRGAANKSAGRSSSADQSSGTDDLPFETETKAATTVAVATATKQRSFRVVCPMCETVGYISPKSAGTRVKCANPKCLVPTFDAPQLPPPEPEKPPEPPRKPNYILLGGGTAAICIIGGIVAYFVASQPAASPVAVNRMTPEEAARLLAETAPAANTANNQTKNSGTPDGTPQTTTETTPNPGDTKTAAGSTVDLAKELPILIEKTVLIRGSQNRSLPFSRQMAAEAYALLGNIEKAQEQVVAFDRVGQNVPFYKISILTELGWAQLRAGTSDAAKASALAAYNLVNKLPGNGRSRLIFASRLGSLLIATGEADKATQLANDYATTWKPGLIDSNLVAERLERQDGQVAALLQSGLDDFAGSIAQVTATRPGVVWFEPQAAAMARSAAAHGFSEKAISWAISQPEVRQLEALGEIAAFEGATAPPDATAEALKAKFDSWGANASVMKLPASKAYLFARGAAAVASVSRPAALGLIKEAQTLLEPVELPAPMTWPKTQGLINPQLPAVAPLERLFVAWAEVSIACQLAGDTAGCDAALSKALATLQGVGPALNYVDQFLEQLNGPDVASIRDRLKDELGIRTEDAARQAFSSYRRGTLNYREHAAIRYDLELQALDRLAQAGGQAIVWKKLQELASDTNAVQKQVPSEISMKLVSSLATAFQLANEPTQAQAVTDWYSGVTRIGAITPSATLLAASRFAAKDGAGAAAVLKEADAPTRALMTSLLAGQLKEVGMVEPALVLIGQTSDLSVREEASIFAAHAAHHQGEAAKIVTHLQTLPQATERLSWIRGLSMPIKK